VSTYRTAVNVIQAFPQLVEAVRQNVDPLDIELGVIRAINWECNKLANDAAVVRCVRYVMEQRGFTLNDLKDE
jgi:antitoxin component HigA of HigAB toxin-antitoxin module